MPLRDKPFADIWTYTGTNGSIINADGDGVAVADNARRITYDASGNTKGILVEPVRENLFLNSLVDGTNLATQSVTVTAAAHTVSFYGSGTITFSGAHTGSLVGTDSTTLSSTTFTPSAGSLTCTVTGTVFWANCELGSYETSHIPTAASTVTRTADVCTSTDTSWQNPTGFTVTVDYDADNLNTGQVLFQIDDGSEDNKIAVISESGGKVRLVVSVSGVDDNTNSTIDFISGAQVVVTADQDEISIAVDGETAVNSGISSFAFTDLTTLRLGIDSSLSNALSGTIARLQVEPIYITGFGALLLEDGTSNLLLEDGTSNLIFS